VKTDYYVGWDVGGWNCDKNPNSRDAIVILDADGAATGSSWRGNLTKYINVAAKTHEFLDQLFVICGRGDVESQGHRVVLAIDAPLGFPEAFQRLLSLNAFPTEIGTSASNEYLFRVTERRLVDEGVQPLSAIKDMIGSQATKAMHVVAKFASNSPEIGVWSDGELLTVIETYPALCRSRLGQDRPKSSGPEADIADAEICARVALAFGQNRGSLEAPIPGLPINEGWIWAPKRQ
jgi:predicted nuclease with RNAse H fold